MEQEFQLKYPFEHQGVKYEVLVARRPTMRDIRNFSKNMDKDMISALQSVLADLTKVPNPVMELVDPEDFGPMKQWFEGFLKFMITSDEA